jgi:hypothetical protein
MRTSALQAASSFQRDVVQETRNNGFKEKRVRDEIINDELLAKAMPLADYEAQKLPRDADGNYMRISDRSLKDNNADDFYVDDNDRYSFTGYSMKYAKCQPVQYFSDAAITAGEHSPMIIEDIVILRLCPQKSCSQSAQYGCHYNYAEYAISLADYLKIVLKYSAKRHDDLCPYCEGCGVVYSGSAATDDKQGGRRRLEDGVGGNDDKAAGANQGDDNANNRNNNNAASCDNKDTYCADYNTQCGDNSNQNDDGYLSYDGYLNYLTCTEVKYNDHSYFVRPYCDGYKGTIKMAAFYDTYCVQYTKDVNVKDLGIGFKEGIFEDFYSGVCIECSGTDEAPYYDTNSTLCNKLHSTSAKCTSDLLYNLFDGEAASSTECSYIESIRMGTYDEEGKLSSATSGVAWSSEVSSAQKSMLAISVMFVFAFVIYSCYLHHSMTNLLIKSLSHRELLPPSRHRMFRRAQKSRNGSDGSDNDWEKPGLV